MSAPRISKADPTTPTDARATERAGRGPTRGSGFSTLLSQLGVGTRGASGEGAGGSDRRPGASGTGQVLPGTTSPLPAEPSKDAVSTVARALQIPDSMLTNTADDRREAPRLGGSVGGAVGQEPRGAAAKGVRGPVAVSDRSQAKVLTDGASRNSDAGRDATILTKGPGSSVIAAPVRTELAPRSTTAPRNTTPEATGRKGDGAKRESSVKGSPAPALAVAPVAARQVEVAGRSEAGRGVSPPLEVAGPVAAHPVTQDARSERPSVAAAVEPKSSPVATAVEPKSSPVATAVEPKSSPVAAPMVPMPRIASDSRPRPSFTVAQAAGAAARPAAQPEQPSIRAERAVEATVAAPVARSSRPDAPPAPAGQASTREKDASVVLPAPGAIEARPDARASESRAHDRIEKGAGPRVVVAASAAKEDRVPVAARSVAATKIANEATGTKEAKSSPLASEATRAVSRAAVDEPAGLTVDVPGTRAPMAVASVAEAKAVVTAKPAPPSAVGEPGVAPQAQPAVTARPAAEPHATETVKVVAHERAAVAARVTVNGQAEAVVKPAPEALVATASERPIEAPVVRAAAPKTPAVRPESVVDSAPAGHPITAQIAAGIEERSPEVATSARTTAPAAARKPIAAARTRVEEELVAPVVTTPGPVVPTAVAPAAAAPRASESAAALSPVEGAPKIERRPVVVAAHDREERAPIVGEGRKRGAVEKREESTESTAPVVTVPPVAPQAPHTPFERTGRRPASDSHPAIEASGRREGEGKESGRPAEAATPPLVPPLPADQARAVFETPIPIPAPLPPSELAPPAAFAPAAAAPIVAQAAEDAGLSVAVLPNSARLSVESGEGDLALHLRIKDGNAEISMAGSLAPMFEQRTAEVQTVLAGEGLNLGRFDFNDNRQNQPAPRELPGDESPSGRNNPQPVVTPASSADSESPVHAVDGRIHVTA